MVMFVWSSRLYNTLEKDGKDGEMRSVSVA